MLRTSKNNSLATTTLTGLLALCAAASGARACLAADDASHPPQSVVVAGVTGPSRTSVLGFSRPGRIAGITVEEGDTVRRGDLLISLDDAPERSRVEIARAHAYSRHATQSARAKAEYFESELDRLTRLYGEEFAATKELRDAEFNALIARLEYERALFDRKQAQRTFEREQRMLERLLIRAPFDGYVAAVLKDVGESVNEREGVLTLVKLDPLEVVLNCPLDAAAHVRVADAVVVRPANPRFPEREGRVAFTTRAADGASQTFRVRVLVDNADSAWMAGVKVEVEFRFERRSAQKRAVRTVQHAPDDD